MPSALNTTSHARLVAIAFLSAGVAACSGGRVVVDRPTRRHHRVRSRTGTAPAPAPPPPSPAPAPSINAVLGKPGRLLGGLGAGNPIEDMKSQQIHPDIIDTYLVGVGARLVAHVEQPRRGLRHLCLRERQGRSAPCPCSRCTRWPPDGEGNLSGINDATFMDQLLGPGQVDVPEDRRDGPAHAGQPGAGLLGLRCWQAHRRRPDEVAGAREHHAGMREPARYRRRPRRDAC